MASSPLVAEKTSYPANCSLVTKTFNTAGSSSTTKMLAFDIDKKGFTDWIQNRMCVEYLININLTSKNITLSTVKDISSISTNFFYYSNNF